MPNAWKTYASINDDVRHTYERVFFGRETTADLDKNDVPGMAQPGTGVTAGTDPAAPAVTSSTLSDLYGGAGTETHAEREAMATAYQHAETAPGIRQEIDAAQGNPYAWANAPDIQMRGKIADLYGPDAGPGNAASQIEAPSVEAPPIEAPAIEPAAAAPANDMTPG